MNTQCRELFERLNSNNNDWWADCIDALANYGVTSVCYGIVPLAKEAQLRGIHNAGFYKTNHPPEWVEILDDDYELTADMVVRENRSTVWHDDSQWDGASEQYISVANRERDLGMDVGVTLSLSSFTNTGCVSGIGLSMASLPRHQFDSHWQAKGEQIKAICNLLDAGMFNHRQSNLLVRLSPREIDVLSYLAAGLRPGEIADHLNLSEKTLEKYIFGAKRKLNARSRDAAVAKALILGLATP